MQGSKSRTSEDALFQKYSKLGYTEQQIKQAYKQSNNDKEFEQLLMEPQSLIINQFQTTSKFLSNQDDEINKAIQASLALQKQNQTFGKLRKDGVPCGLANVGNTCYFNSLLQGYFFIFDFVDTIIKCKFDTQLIQNAKEKRLQNSIELVKNLQQLFINLIGSDRQFIDPKRVLQSICDDFGQILPIGDQKDVGEFNYYFLSRINEGITYLNSNQQKQPVAQSMIIEQNISQNSSIIQFESTQSEIQRTSRFIRQSSIVNENTSIFQIFFGKYILQHVHQGKILQETGPEIFNFIQIDVNSNNLQDGLENYMNQSYQELSFQTGQYDTITRQLWITSAPQILNFQIQRVYYDKDFQSMLKKNSPFQFPQEIFIDRYLEENQKISKEIQKQNTQFRDRLRKIQDELQNLVKFNGNIDLINHLETTLSFLKIQNQFEKDNPYYIDSNDNKAAIQQITSYLNELIKKRDCLLKEQVDLTKRISESYNSMKKSKYVLQSILIHEGSAEGGHYYAYIYNFEQNKWHCFNDAIVTEEPDEKVMSQAIGDSSNSKSAYLLSYVREDIAKKGLNLMIKKRTFSVSTNKNYLKDQYGVLLTQQQRELVQQENQRLLQEVEQNKMQEAVEQILKQYCVYFESFNEKYRHYQSQAFSLPFRPYPTQHLAVYIRSRNENMYKQVMIDLAIKKITGSNFINNPKKNIPLLTLLLEEIKSLNEQKYPYILEPIINDYIQYTEEFKSILRNSQSALYVTEQYLNGNFKIAIQSLHQYIKKAKTTHQQSFFFQVADFLKWNITLGILLQLIQKLTLNETDISVLKLLVAFQMQEHLQFLEPKFWKDQILNLISIALKDQSPHEILKPIITNNKNQEFTQQLDQTLQEQIISCDTLLEYYQTNELIDQLENLASDNLMANLQKLYHNQSCQKLYHSFKTSSSILDKKDIEQIINLKK